MVWLGSKPEHNAEDMEWVKHKPLKRRGLSRFYSSKSQSFSSLEMAHCTPYGDSALGLGKRLSSSDLQREDSLEVGPTLDESSEHESFFDLQELVYSYKAPRVHSLPTGSHLRGSVWLSAAAEDMCAALKLTSLGADKGASSRRMFSDTCHMSESQGNLLNESLHFQETQ